MYFKTGEYDSLLQKLLKLKQAYSPTVGDTQEAVRNDSIADLVHELLDQSKETIWETLKDKILLKALLQYLELDGIVVQGAKIPRNRNNEIIITDQSIVRTGSWHQKEFLVLQLFTYIKHFAESKFTTKDKLDSYDDVLQRSIDENKSCSRYETLLLREMYILINAYTILILYKDILEKPIASGEKKIALNDLFTGYLDAIQPLLSSHKEFILPCGSITHAIYLTVSKIKEEFYVRVDDSARSEVTLLKCPESKRNEPGGFVDYLVNVALVYTENNLTAKSVIHNQPDENTGVRPFALMSHCGDSVKSEEKQTVENCVYRGFYRNRQYRISRALNAEVIFTVLVEMEHAFAMKKFRQPSSDDVLLANIAEGYKNPADSVGKEIKEQDANKFFPFGNSFGLVTKFPNFHGRQSELTKLRNNCGGAIPTTVKIVGLAGMGKSVLAGYLADQLLEEKKINWVIWLSGGEDIEAVKSSMDSQFVSLAEKLNLNPQRLVGEKLYVEIYKRLFAKGKGLFVFDDFPEYGVISQVLPENFKLPKVDIWITTQNETFFSDGIEEVRVGPLSLPEAVEYIRSYLSVSEEDATLLAVTLKRCPLFITQALPYIKNNCTVQEFCNDYNGSLKDRELLLAVPVGSGDSYEKERLKRLRSYDSAAILSVVQMSLKQVKKHCVTAESYQLAQSLLLAAAYLAPESPIIKVLFRKWSGDEVGHVLINLALTGLRTLSLLESVNDIDHFLILQVVQDVVRLGENPGQVLTSLLKWCNIIIKYLEEPSPMAGAVDEKKYISLEPHMARLTNQLDQCKPSTDEILLAKREMLDAVGLACEFQGKEKEAQSRYEQVIECHQKMSSEQVEKNKYKEGVSLMHLGAVRLACGEVASSLSPVNKALVTLESTVGRTHVDYGRCLMHLGLIKLSLGEVREAKSKFEEALTILRNNLTENHKEIAECLMNLGSANLSGGDPKAAYKKLNEALPLLISSLGINHTDVGRCLLNIGLATLNSGDPATAKVHILDSLPILQTTLGDSHADVGRCRMNLGLTILETGNPKKAREYMVDAIEILKATLGEKHTDVAKCLSNLGLIELELNNLPGLKDCISNAQEILSTKESDDDLDVGKCYLSLGRLVYSSHRFKLAKKYLDKALSIFEKTINNDSVEVGLCLMHLGMSALFTKRTSDADACFAKAMPVLEKTLGAENVIVGKCLMARGQLAIALNDAHIGKVYFLKALPILKRTLGKAHIDVGRAMGSLGAALLDIGLENEVSKNYLIGALAILKRSLRSDNEEVVAYSTKLATAALKTGDPFLATSVLRQAGVGFQDYCKDHPEFMREYLDLYPQAVEMGFQTLLAEYQDIIELGHSPRLTPRHPTFFGNAAEPESTGLSPHVRTILDPPAAEPRPNPRPMARIDPTMFGNVNRLRLQLPKASPAYRLEDGIEDDEPDKKYDNSN